ncbi:MotE family protein [Amphibacillus sp. Q70]|uniref:MotE family protein n=1 Tax=Amphibacillus sp. Q70 TaxID=3453416 RepID=UPI003F82C6CE
MAERPNQNSESKKISFLQWIFLIIIPLILAISITFIVLSLLDLNPIDKAKEFANHIPIINNFVTTEEEEELERKERQYQNQIDDLESEMAILESDLIVKTTEVDQLNQEITRLNNQLDNLREESSEEEEEGLDDNLTKLIDTYQEMAPKKAAPILANMSDPIAIGILREIDEAQRAAILSAMDPENAAAFSEQLLD